MTDQPPSIVLSPALTSTVPACIETAGSRARFAFDEFFQGQIRNPHTRAAYLHAVRRFLTWIEERGLALTQIEPGTVGTYFNQHSGSIPTKKLHLAGLRAFFDVLVNRHVLLLNPAATVRGDRYSIVEGKTPEISRKQARMFRLRP